MAQKVRTSAKKKASQPVGDTLRMVLVRGATLKELSHIELPPDTGVALIPGASHGFKEIRAAIGPIKADVREVAAVAAKLRFSKSAAPTVGKRLAGVEPINQGAFEPDARSRAILEGVRIAQKDLEDAGGAYDLEQVRMLLRGVSRQAIDKRVQQGSLLAVPGPSNRRSFPTLQFNRDGSVLAGLKEVREALPVESPWAVLNFLANPDDRLGGRKPVDVLRAGKVAQVIQAARLYGEPGG